MYKYANSILNQQIVNVSICWQMHSHSSLDSRISCSFCRWFTGYLASFLRVKCNGTIPDRRPRKTVRMRTVNKKKLRHCVLTAGT